MSEKVLVTGASGFIGSHVVCAALEAGYDVRGTVRSLKNESKVKELKELPGSNRLELVETDLLDEDCWLNVVKGCEYVLHVASPVPRLGTMKREELIRTAKSGTLNVLTACGRTPGVKHVVLTSSVAAIIPGTGAESDKEYTEEEWAAVLDDEMLGYNASKIEAERAAWDLVEKLSDEDKFELTTINPTLVLGPVLTEGSKNTASLAFIKEFVITSRARVPNMCFPIADVRDVARAHVQALKLPDASGKRILVSTDSYWMTDIAKVLADELNPRGYRVPTSTAPSFVVWLMSFFSADARNYYRNMHKKKTLVSNERMRNILKIDPIPYKKTLLDTAESLIKYNVI